MAAIRVPTATPISTSNGEVPNSPSRTSPETAPPTMGTTMMSVTRPMILISPVGVSCAMFGSTHSGRNGASIPEPYPRRESPALTVPGHPDIVYSTKRLNMVSMLERRDLEATFSALGDPVRRAIVDRLALGDATVNQLAAQFPISLQAVSKHIGVLEAAGVVTRRREGQTRPVHLEAAPLTQSVEWLEAHRRRLESRYVRLDELLETKKEPA